MRCKWIGLCIFAVSVFALGVGADPLENEELLSADETMGVIFRSSSDYQLLRLANPDVRPMIYAFLEDETFESCHPQGIRVLGWVGEESDVVELRKIADRLQGPLAEFDRRKMRAILEAWATMARRNVTGAAEEIGKFCAINEWDAAPFSWRAPEAVKNNPQCRYDGPIEAIRIYSVFGDGNMKELREQLLENIGHQGARERVKYYLSEKYIVPAIQKRKEQEVRPVTALDRERLRGELERIKAIRAGRKGVQGEVSDGDEPAENALALSQSLSGQTRAYVEALLEESVSAYGEFLSTLLSEQYSVLLENILNNGEPLDPDKTLRNRDGLIKDLQIEKALMAEAREIGLLNRSQYRNFQISLTVTGSLGQIDTQDWETRPPKGSETVTVFFVIPESAAIYRKHIPQVGVGSAEKTVTPEGDLQVYMKRINGKWYWNPFGW